MATEGSSPNIDFAQLELPELESLIEELLLQMGFGKPEWFANSKPLEGEWGRRLKLELPRKDPDGSKYLENWLVSLFRLTAVDLDSAPAMTSRRLGDQPGVATGRLLKKMGLKSNLEALDHQAPSGVTSLILLPFDVKPFWFDFGKSRSRLWDVDHLRKLVSSYPQIVEKYFSREARQLAQFRKNPEDLYQEYVRLLGELRQKNTELELERDLRVTAERDAVWKDISFSTAHKLGNPLFAIDNYLDPLEKRITAGRTQDALAILAKLRHSLEIAKDYIDQLKSLTRALETQPRVFRLRPLLDEVCAMAEAKEIAIEINCEESIEVFADPRRLSEVFDELVANSIRRFDKTHKKIVIHAGVDSRIAKLRISFADNGPGVSRESKQKIFDAFFTTDPHGTGLGLALVRRIIEGHGGEVAEVGEEGRGACFVIVLPAVGPVELESVQP